MPVRCKMYVRRCRAIVRARIISPKQLRQRHVGGRTWSSRMLPSLGDDRRKQGRYDLTSSQLVTILGYMAAPPRGTYVIVTYATVPLETVCRWRAIVRARKAATAAPRCVTYVIVTYATVPRRRERQGRVQILRREKPETFVRLVKTHVPTVAVGTFVLYLGLTGKAHADSPSVQLGGLHASRHATQRPPRRTEVNEQGVGTGTRSDHAWVTWASRQAAPRVARQRGEEDARGEAAITVLAAQYKGHVHKRHVPSWGRSSQQ